jgi:hypothetical protein
MSINLCNIPYYKESTLFANINIYYPWEASSIPLMGLMSTTTTTTLSLWLMSAARTMPSPKGWVEISSFGADIMMKR